MRHRAGARARILFLLLPVAAVGAVLLLRPHRDSPAPERRTASSAPEKRLFRVERLDPEPPAAPLPRESARPARPVGARTEPPPDFDRRLREPRGKSPSTLQAGLVLSREDVIKEREGVFGYNCRNYGATLDGSGVEFAPAFEIEGLGRPHLQISLEEVRAGGEILASGGRVSPRALPDERAISYDRGTVEERYVLGTDALEQVFVIRELPPERGRISVAATVRTNLDPPADGTAGLRLAFSHEGTELASVSHAVAIDGGGRRLPLPLVYSRGRLSIHVPAFWVAEAALPITIDPLIGGPIVVDPSLTKGVMPVAGLGVRACDAAYNPNENSWLVVWSEPFGAGIFNFDVLGQRVSASGMPLGATIPIGVSAEGDYEPTVSFAPGSNRFLVAWRHDPSIQFDGHDQRIHGRVLGGDGVPVTGVFIVDDDDGQDFAPSAAFDGTRWLVCFTNRVQGENYDIRGRFVAPAGVPGPAADPDSEPDFAVRPSVDFAAGVYVVAWEKGPPGGIRSVVARAMSPAGTFPGPITPVDQSALPSTQADVSAGAGKFLIVWRHEAAPGNGEVLGRIATPSLAFETPAFTVNATPSDQEAPRAAFSALSSEWFVAYSDTATGATDIYGSRVTPTGMTFPPDRLTENTLTDGRPEIAWSSAANEMLVAYLHGNGNAFQIQARRWQMDVTSPPPAPTNFAGAAPSTGSILWSWEDVALETGYALHDDLHAAKGMTGAGVTSILESTFTENALASRHAHALNAFGSSPASNSAARYTRVHDPVAADLMLMVVSHERIDVTVIAVPNGAAGLTGCEIQRSPDGAAWMTIKPYSSVYGHIDLPLPASTLQHYRVRFRNGDGVETAFSPVKTATTLPPPPPPAPAAFDGLAQTPNSILWSWSDVPGETGYQLHDDGHAVRGMTAADVIAFLEAGLAENVLASRHVHATGPGGTSPPSTSAARYTKVHDPLAADFAVAAVSSSRIEVMIVPPPGAASGQTGCEIQRSPDGAAWATIRPFAPTYAFSDTGLPPNTTQHYRFRFRNGDAVVTAFSPSKSATTQSGAPPPGAPTGLTAAPGNAQISLAWNASAGATGYRVKRSTRTGGPYGTVAMVPGLTAHVDAGLVNGAAYSYVVTAENAGGESGPSNQASATPTLGPPPPTGLSALAGDMRVALAWEAAGGATSYNVKRSTAPGGPFATVATGVAATAHTDPGLANGTRYYYVVTGANAGGEGGPSNVASAIPIGPPAGLAAARDDRKILLDWNDSPAAGLAGYNVYRSLSAGGPYARVNVALLAASAFTDTGLVNGTTYFYVARAQNTLGQESVNSNEASARPTPSPRFLTWFDQTVNSILWAWEGIAGVTGYVVHDPAHVTRATAGPGTGFVTALETGLGENAPTLRHVHATDAMGLTGPTESLTVFTNVHDAVDSDFALTPVSGEEVDIMVVPPPNATLDRTGVRIERSLDGVTWIRVDPPAGVYTHRDTGLLPRTTYQVRIRYRNGQGSLSALSPIKTVTTLQPTPPNFTGAGQTTTSILWSWSDVAGETGFELHDDAHGVKGATGAGVTSLAEGGFTENARVSRHVHGLEGASPSAASNTAARHTLVHDALAADFVLTALSASQVRIDVVPPPGSALGSTGCEVQRLIGATWTTVKPFSAVYGFTEAGLSPATLHSYRIRLRNGDAAASAFSPAQGVTTPAAPATPPAAPANFTGTALSANSIEWRWDDVADEAGYDLHDAGHSAKGMVLADVLLIVEGLLAENAPHTRHVHAVNAAGPSPASNSLTRHTRVHDPVAGDLSLLVASRFGIDIAVTPPPNPPSGLTGCEIERFTGGAWAVIRPFSAVYTHSEGGLTPGTPYDFRFRYRNAEGAVTPFSPVRSATTFTLPPPVITTPSKKTRNPNPNVRGTAATGETVTVFFNGLLDGTAANTGGMWTYSATAKAEGIYTVKVYGSLSGFSDSITIRVDLTAPAPPAEVRTTPFNNTIDVEWDPSQAADVAGYEVQRKTGTEGTWGLLNTTGLVLNLRYRDSTAVNGQTYFYRVVAVDDSVDD